MIDNGKRDLLGVGVNVIDYEGSVARIITAAQARQPLSVSALAVHGVMEGFLNAEQKYRLNRLDLVVPDGHPVRWALRLLHGQKLYDRVCGPELVDFTLAEAERLGLPVFLYGSRDEVLDGFVARIRRLQPKLIIAGVEASKFRSLTEAESRALQSRVIASGARILLVGLGCPRQEVFAFENARPLSMPVMAVGAAFDFHAGTVARAPEWMRSNGLEWLFRLTREPLRLWRRYLLLNPLYMAMVAAQMLWGKAVGWTGETEPRSPIRYG